jgi:hypothetical protein
MKTNLIFNPFTRIAGWQALGLGMLIMLATAAIAIPSNLRFDGVLDAHFYKDGAWWKPFADQLINWLALTLVFSLAALLLAKSHFRFIDIAGTMALARAPMLLASLAGLPGIVSSFFTETPQINSAEVLARPSFWLFASLALLMVWATVWSAIFVYNAWSISANVKGARAGFSYAICLIIAEIGSKILITQL